MDDIFLLVRYQVKSKVVPLIPILFHTIFQIIATKLHRKHTPFLTREELLVATIERMEFDSVLQAYFASQAEVEVVPVRQRGIAP